MSDDKFEVKLYKDEKGNRYGKSVTCFEKCFWTVDEMVHMCPRYNIMQVGNKMKEWCDEAEAW